MWNTQLQANSILVHIKSLPKKKAYDKINQTGKEWKMNKKSVIIIPSLNPDRNLILYCQSLIKAGFDKLILINDGSSCEYSSVFLELKKMQECTILTHAINLGKGRALKDAFNYFLTLPDCNSYNGVITVDSDGQHTIEDVLKLQDELSLGKNELILGARDFNNSNVPPKSKFGNKLTCFVFRLLHSARLKDTQTGLRAIPASLISTYLDLSGERFEYETNMLIVTAMKHIPFCEIEIQTIYLNENKGTHFNPVRDSLAIYKLLFSTFIKYTIASLSSFILDIAIFQFILMLTGDITESIRIFIATVFARILSSVYNFLINKNVVFQKRERSIAIVIRYYVLCIIQMCCSASLVLLFYRCLRIPEIIVKIVVDTLLFLISYRIQKHFIFKR